MIFPDEEIKITTEAEEGSNSTYKHDFMISCFNHPIISDLIMFE
jgi:hypothetical protein